MYDIRTLGFIRAMKSDGPIVLVTKHVAFAEQYSKVVTGTDHSKAVVYDSNTGEVIQDLSYLGKGMIQPIAVLPPSQWFDAQH